MAWYWIALSCTLVSYNVIGQEQCQVGHSDQSVYSPLSINRFYLNTQNQSQCNGTVTSWEYCYYPPRDNDASVYRTLFALYQVEDSDEERLYQRVSQTFSIAIESENITISETTTLQCGQVPVTKEVAITEGDIIGVCIYNTNIFSNQEEQLTVVGRNADGYSLMQTTLGTYTSAACENASGLITPEAISSERLRIQNSRVLHLFANIEPSTESTTNQSIIEVNMTMVSTNSPTTTNSPLTTTTKHDMTTHRDQPPGDSSTLAVAIGIAVPLVIVVISLVLLAIITTSFVFIARRKTWQIRPELEKPENEYEAKHGGIDNPNYDGGMAKPYLIESYPSYELVESPHQDLTEEEGNITLVAQPYEVPASSYSKLFEQNKEEDIYSDVKRYRSPSNVQSEIYGQIHSCGVVEIPRAAIKSSTHLGSGRFGSVKQGLWETKINHSGSLSSVPVALKALNEKSTEEDKVKFLQEAAITAQFKHPNVVTLYGVVSKGEPVLLIVELVSKGDLRKYLLSIRPQSAVLPSADLPRLLLSFSQQVALGMQYLAGKGFVHRDLAARNILVSDNNVCKIADFGMSRDLADASHYISHGGEIPVKWTAPEAIHFMKYSTASDVWSYGCLLYEIWSLGHKPFEGVSNIEVLKILNSGRRLSPPAGCPKMMYEIMMECWHPSTTHRPTFRDLVLSLMESESDVLSIPQEALNTHQLAGVLGAPLEAGEMMYRDIQNTYNAAP